MLLPIITLQYHTAIFVVLMDCNYNLFSILSVYLVTYYCSRECQKLDYKSHKRFCVPPKKGGAKTLKDHENTLMHFAQLNYEEIMTELVKVCDANDWDKSHVLLELDFKAEIASGTSPALRDPPEFAIKDAKGYFEGSRPNEPDWFYKNEDHLVYQRNTKSLFAFLKDQYERLTADDLLCFVRFESGSSCFRLKLYSAEGSHMFSQDAMDAYRAAINEEDYGPLERMFNIARVELLKKKLGRSNDADLHDLLRMVRDFDLLREGINRSEE